MEGYLRSQLLKNGYELVNTPHITKGHLFETSGHLQWYKEGMFPAMHLDEEVDEAGNVTKQGQDYYLKPMNCPMHHLIFRARGRSYRELPLRLAEFGTVYRYEKSGTLSGLTRVRGLTQDDAHVYVTREQVKEEITRQLDFVLETLRGYGLSDFYLELSTKDLDKYVGDDEVWDEATETLREVAVASGLELVPDPGGAAFYGPKISVQARDAIGRTWQLSTVQLDFNMPDRFELEYTASDGSRQRPVLTVGVDIGGTFTDLVESGDGRLTIHKLLSTPTNPAQAMLAGLNVITPGGLTALQQVSHGSTVATNAILERKGAKTALITTQGFRDLLFIGRQNRPQLYALQPQLPAPFIPRRWCYEIPERLDYTGKVLTDWNNRARQGSRRHRDRKSIQ